MRRLTKKQEIFCLKYVELGDATQASLLAGYAPKYARENTDHVLDRPLVQARIKELRQIAEDETVMMVLERKRRLSEIARAKVRDKFQNPIQAIDVLNKMDKIYSEGAQVNIDNRKIEITVVSEKAKELVERIMLGERT
jgi:phage terminase small subunit